MRNTERLRKLKEFMQKNLCDGRSMKAPADDLDYTKFLMQEPRCYLGWAPTRPDITGLEAPDPYSAIPGILIMPNQSQGKYVEEQHFDRYKGIKRGQELGQNLTINLLFSIYEPGIRLPGFVDEDGNIDPEKIMEGTEQGLMTLYDWMDDCMELLLGIKMVPGTDLFVQEASLTYSPYTDSSYIVDKRPIFYGIVNVTFTGYANDGVNPAIQDFLK